MPARVPTPERRDGDTDKSYRALCDYARMGPARSMTDLQRSYSETTGEKPPTKSLRWLHEWSRTHDWQARVQDYDDAMRAAADEAVAREMLTGLALPAHRVRFIKDVLEGMTPEDVRAALKASPSTAAQIRGFLGDLAKETGGRKQNLDLTTKGESLNDARRDLNDASPVEIAEAYRELAKGAG